MKQIVDVWFADHFSWGPVQSCRSWASRIATALLAALILHPLACAGTAPAAQLTHASKQKAVPHKPVPPLIAEVNPEPAPPPAPPSPRTPAEMPPVAPEVVWDGKLLSIRAENSTLSSILAAVRTQTGASMDIPPGAGGERVVVQLGPAPVREVLTSLLYGTNYDYIIQASDTNQDSVSKVIITARGNGDDVVADAGSGGSSKGSGVRRPPGYSPSGKPSFVAQYEAQAEQSANAEAAAKSATESDSASTESAAQSPAGNEDAQRASSSLSSDSSPVAGNDTPPATASASPSAESAASGSSGDQSPTTKMIQDMQLMFQQRRQIQAQQNQAQQNQNQPPPAN